MSYTHLGTISVKKTRKWHRCEWCPEPIEIGEPAEGWKGIMDGDAFTAYMHPECDAAFNRCLVVKAHDWYDNELPWESHSNKRGQAMVEPAKTDEQAAGD